MRRFGVKVPLSELEKDAKIRKYNRMYYVKKRENLLRRKKERYKVDPAYRNRQIARSKMYHDKYVKPEHPGLAYKVKKIGEDSFFTISYLAQTLGYSQSYVRVLEKEGVIPQTIYTDSRKWRLYSKAQIELCVMAFREYVGDRWTKEECSEYLHKFWG
jgi:hypothetical protein